MAKCKKGFEQVKGKCMKTKKSRSSVLKCWKKFKPTYYNMKGDIVKNPKSKDINFKNKSGEQVNLDYGMYYHQGDVEAGRQWGVTYPSGNKGLVKLTGDRIAVK